MLIVYKTNKTTISVLVCETWRLPVDDCQVSIFRVLLGRLDDKADFICENPYKKFLSHKKYCYKQLHVCPCVFQVRKSYRQANTVVILVQKMSCVADFYTSWQLIHNYSFSSQMRCYLINQESLFGFIPIHTAFNEERSFSSVLVALDSRPRSKPMPLEYFPQSFSGSSHGF